VSQRIGRDGIASGLTRGSQHPFKAGRRSTVAVYRGRRRVGTQRHEIWQLREIWLERADRDTA
jgi:hypothetical protein